MTERPVALVTGAARGIGRAEATAFARAGYDIAVTHHTTSPAAAQAELVAAGLRDPLIVRADLTNPDDVEGLRDSVSERYGRLDVLVCNVGAGKPWAGVRLSKLTDEGWRSLLDANVSTAFYCMRALNDLLAEGPGLIVTTSSIHALTGGRPGWVAYGAAKAALIALSQGAAREMPATVVCLVLGLIDTDQLRASLGERVAVLEKQNPIGRMISPEEVAAFVVSLAQLSSESINGSVFELSGGRRDYVLPQRQALAEERLPGAAEGCFPMIAAGVNARALCSYMGHASVTITYDRYGHLMPGNEDEAAALLDAYLERANTRARLAALED